MLDTLTNTTNVHPLSSPPEQTGNQLFLPVYSKKQSYSLERIDKERVWRHSTTARYNLTNSETVKTHRIRAKNGQDILQLCKFGSMEDTRLSLVYVVGNNLYWREDGLLDDPSKDIQITSDGVPGIVFNGIPDWVYEEEVLFSASAFYVSNDKIAYAQFNDSKVPEFKYPHFGNPNQTQDFKYPLYK